MRSHLLRRMARALLLVLFIGVPALSLQAQQSGHDLQERHAIHLMKIQSKDPELYEALEQAWDSLQGGSETVILFDGQSVTALRMRARNQNRSLLQDEEITAEKRRALAERLGVSVSDAPRNTLELVQHLSKAGVKVYANRNAAQQYGLREKEIHPLATLISTGQISDILDKSDFCYTVGGP